MPPAVPFVLAWSLEQSWGVFQIFISPKQRHFPLFFPSIIHTVNICIANVRCINCHVPSSGHGVNVLNLPPKKNISHFSINISACLSLLFPSRHGGFAALTLGGWCFFFFFFSPPLLWKAFLKSFPAADFFGCTDTQEEGELIPQPCLRAT